jgi:hypothetical protein
VKKLHPPNPEQHAWTQPHELIGADGFIVVHWVDKNRFSQVKLVMSADQAETRMWAEKEDISHYFNDSLLWQPGAHFNRTFVQVSSPHQCKISFKTGDIIL